VRVTRVIAEAHANGMEVLAHLSTWFAIETLTTTISHR
jgi:hypothetical protein